MKVKACISLILILVLATVAGAQSVSPVQAPGQLGPMSGFWTDPATGLMWAGKDNGKNVNWPKAMKYCQNLRLAGFTDWRLATTHELWGIWDATADSPGRLGNGEPHPWHVKGNLFLTGVQWSSSQWMDDRGLPQFAYYLDFLNGGQGKEDSGRFGASYGRRALCVRGPVK